MKMFAAPSRKRQSRKVISDSTIPHESASASLDGTVSFSFLAKSLYNDDSTYEYTLWLTRDEIGTLWRASHAT